MNYYFSVTPDTVLFWPFLIIIIWPFTRTLRFALAPAFTPSMAVGTPVLNETASSPSWNCFSNTTFDSSVSRS